MKRFLFINCVACTLRWSDSRGKAAIPKILDQRNVKSRVKRFAVTQNETLANFTSIKTLPQKCTPQLSSWKFCSGIESLNMFWLFYFDVQRMRTF